MSRGLGEGGEGGGRGRGGEGEGEGEREREREREEEKRGNIPEHPAKVLPGTVRVTEEMTSLVEVPVMRYPVGHVHLMLPGGRASFTVPAQPTVRPGERQMLRMGSRHSSTSGRVREGQGRDEGG
jgi:hypothetical protein